MDEPAQVPTEHLEHEIHHEAEHAGKRWVLGVALSSALLASLAAVASLSAGHFANEAMISQIESANQWSYYQSKSIKEAQLNSKLEILAALDKPATDQDRRKLAEYAGDKEQIQRRAEGLEKEAKHFLRIHQFLARSVTLFQVAIAIGAISVLTKRRKFWYVSLGFGVVGLCFFAQSWFTLHGH